MRSVINTITDYDKQLSSLCGLNYQLINLSESKYYSTNDKVWLENDRSVEKNISDFVDENINFIMAVGELYKKLEIGIGNKTNMVITSSDSKNTLWNTLIVLKPYHYHALPHTRHPINPSISTIPGSQTQ